MGERLSSQRSAQRPERRDCEYQWPVCLETKGYNPIPSLISLHESESNRLCVWQGRGCYGKACEDYLREVDGVGDGADVRREPVRTCTW